MTERPTPDAPPTPDAADVINALAGIAPGSPLAELRNLRAAVVQHTQGSYDTLIAPADPAGLSLAERAMAALRVAVLTRSGAFRDHYRRRLAELQVAAEPIAQVEGSLDGAMLPARTVAILRHVEMMTAAPRAATPAQIALLQEHGLSARNIVALAQLVAFVNFQVRLLAGLMLIEEGL